MDPVNLASFDFRPRTRVMFGPGAVNHVGNLARALPATKVLLVTDSGIVSAGHAARVQQLIEAAGIQVTTFGGVRENPGTTCVQQCVEVARHAEVDALVALGGGSSMDTAKGCNFLLTNGGSMKDYWGWGKATQPMLPLVAIPTTAGTGSECQSYALITDEGTHQKMACGDPKAAARIALLDPELTLSQPPRVTACTGVDALAHAVESAVTRNRNPVSALFSREAFRLLAQGISRVFRDPADLEARGAVLLGAAWAGTAIENSMLGAAHSAANPLTARFGIAHGHAVGIMLPHVIRFNGIDPKVLEVYSELSQYILTPPSHFPRVTNASDLLAGEMERILDEAKLPRRLNDLGVNPQGIVELASEAASQWTAKHNPVPIDAEDFKRLYEAAF
jgi:alcohol dehydrogenase